jgi:hypothetical protein
MPDLVPFTQSLPAVTAEDIEHAMTIGDLGKMPPEIRVRYYLAACASAGLNPMTQPFTPLKNQAGQIFLYANKDCAEQLRKRDRISIRVLSRETDSDGLYSVTVAVSTPDGRCDEAQGIVDVSGKKGTALAHAKMLCETKAKRRATLAIAGLGFASAEDAHGEAVLFNRHTGEVAAPAVATVAVGAAPAVGISASELLFDTPAVGASAAPARHHLMNKIDALMADQGLSPAQQGAAWEKWHAKYPDLSPAALTIIYESLEERVHTLYAQEVDAAMVAEDTRREREAGDEDEEDV